MKPYYQDDLATLFHGDCLSVIPHLQPDQAGIVVTDPPYAEETHRGARTGDMRHSKKLVTFDAISIDDLRLRLSAAATIVTRWLVATMEFRHAALLEGEPPTGVDFIRQGVWTKAGGYMPQMSGDRPAMGWESIAIMHRKTDARLHWNGHGRSAVWHVQSQRVSIYPTQKPIELARDFIKLFADPGDVVFDPFCGSGTALVAAYERGHHVIGCDIAEAACEIAATRLRDLKNQGTLFAS